MARPTVLVLVVLALAPALARAQGARPAGDRPSPTKDPTEDPTDGAFEARVRAALPRERVQRIQLWAENDMLVRSGDRYYTNGLRLAYQSNDVPEVVSRFGRGLSIVLPAGPSDWGITVGHSIYTPRDVLEERLIPDDRPYCGWLYVGFSLTRVNEELAALLALARRGPDGEAARWERDLRRAAGGVGVLFQETIELDLGVFGRDSGAASLQREVHRARGIDLPQGWSNQLRSEPGVELLYQRKWLLPILEGRHVQAHVLPHAGVALGTVYTHAALGCTLKVGLDLPYDFGPSQRIGGGLDSLGLLTSALLAPVERERLGLGLRTVYAFARVEARAVAWNAAVEGNAFRSDVRRPSTRGVVESHDVDAERLVADLELGIVVELDCGLSVGFTHVTRTAEFEGQPEAFNFGALHIGWTF